jgi:energy-coupling factor transport system permease protein
VHRLIATCTIGGLVAMLASSYALIDSSAPSALGVPLLLAGGVLAAIGFLLGARRGGRTRYRPDPWALPEWLVVSCGVAAAVTVIVAPYAGVYPSTSPPALPGLPALPLVGLLVAVLPAWLAPPLPRPRAESRRTERAASPELAGAAR